MKNSFSKNKTFNKSLIKNVVGGETPKNKTYKVVKDYELIPNELQSSSKSGHTVERGGTRKYEIIPIETAKNNIPQKSASKKNIMPKFPFSAVISGRSGSGKTQLILNMLTRDDLLGNYFHKILVFSPTANTLDDTYDALKIPAENFIKDFDPKILDTILTNRKKQITKEGVEKVAKTDRVLLLFDDCISEKKFLESPQNLKMFTLLRHYLCSVCILSQSFKKIPRSIRLNANYLAIFPSLQSEINIMLEEITPSGISKNEFRDIIAYCTKGRYDFMAINNHAEPNQRIRKNLSEIISF